MLMNDATNNSAHTSLCRGSVITHHRAGCSVKERTLNFRDLW